MIMAAVGGRAQGNNLDSLVGDSQLRFVFVGGKGGVGKTTSSSAIASQLSLVGSTPAAQGRRVLLVSTDPAHSLSDAFRMNFSNVPTPILPDLPNLEVMEVNPAETMKKELSGWAELAVEMGYDPDKKGDEDGGIGDKIHAFQEWLSGIPGIDEATALSSAIEHIESGRYDMIVFDTAPTGHTLKLLELPKLLQVGLDKLESWQATLWGYWEMLRGFASGSADSAGVKKKVADKLKDYKASIGRVASMITDRNKTRFVAVCIAEYLSISETRRLLGELERFEVLASHVVVNQLVTDALEEHELAELEEIAKGKEDGREGEILSKALAAARLTSARRGIQSKYLKDLRASPEVTRGGLTVLEVPLLPTEVTGPERILNFSHYLVGEKVVEESCKAVGVEGESSKSKRAAQEAAEEAGAKTQKSAPTKKKPKKPMPDMKDMAKSVESKIMADPELAKMVNDSPKIQKVMKEVMDNPMSVMQYMSDPDLAPFVQKAMGKIMGGGGGGGSRKRRRRKSNKDAPPNMEDLLGGLGDLGDLMGGLKAN